MGNQISNNTCNANASSVAANNSSLGSVSAASFASPNYSVSAYTPPWEADNSCGQSPNMVQISPNTNFSSTSGSLFNNSFLENLTRLRTQSAVRTTPKVQAVVNDLNPSNLYPSFFSTLINGILGGPGSSVDMDLELGFGIGANIKLAKAFDGLLLELTGRAEIDEDGKFNIEGGIGFGGYVRAEAALIFEAALEQMANKKIEGEFDSVQFISSFIHAHIVDAAKNIVADRQQDVSDKFIPDVLLEITNHRINRVSSPEITRTGEDRTSGNAAFGDDVANSGISFAHASSSFNKSRDDSATDSGIQSTIEGEKSLTVGRHMGSMAFKHTETDSLINNANDKEEIEFILDVGGVNNCLGDEGCQQLTNLVSRTSNSLTSLTDMATTASRSMLQLISTGTIYSGVPSIPDLTAAAKGTLNLKFKFEKDAHKFKLKFVIVNFGYNLNFTGNAQFPIAGTPVKGEGSTDFSANLERNNFLLSL